MYKALIVDDEPKILQGFSKLLQWEDYGIEIAGLASNGAQALKIMEVETIAILITDINMPEMDGLELIRQIKAHGCYTKFIILSGYDDFTYVKEAVKLGVENYLLKPVIRDELSSTLMNIIEKLEKEKNEQIQSRSDSLIIRNNILNRWLTGDISHKNLMERADLLNIELNSEAYLVCLIKALYEDNHDSAYRNLMNFACENICSEILSASGSVITLCDLSGNMVAVFHGYRSNLDHTEICRQLEICIRSINNSLKLSVFATIGSNAGECSQVHASYADASRLMSYSLIMPPDSVVDHNRMIKSIINEDESIRFDYEGFQANLTAKNRTETLQFIDDTFHKLGKMKEITPLYVQNISTEILYHILNALDSLKINISTFISSDDNLLTRMLRMKSLDELCKWLREIAGKAMEIICAADENTHPLIKRILHHMETNYADNISLKTISADLNVNAAYLGQLFIRVTKETFSNYLNHKRIEKAMELLCGSSLDLNEIAEKVGYVNQSYFNNVFKKVTGIYPTKYRLDNQIIS